MSIGHKHSTRWSFGDILYHRVTGDKGMVLGMVLRPQSPPLYMIVFEGDVAEKNCLELELSECQPTAVESEK